ncbi:ATP-binding protein [Undibacterium luofuense]|uniref:ATP-binding protein n=1 Tax=Undibacterium luofuense TaxID=2828733 RepID=UPI0030EB7269
MGRPAVPPGSPSSLAADCPPASSAQHTNPGGSGLGLAIVHDIVMLHHGQIRLSDACPQDNSHTRGLCVTIHFACLAPPDSAILPPGISPKPTEHHDN